MKKIYLSILLLVFLISCSRNGIVKTYSYVKKSVPGTVRVDDNGRPVNSGITFHHLLFVETDSLKGSPEWGMAWIDQNSYSVQPVKINTNQVIGKTMEGQDVRIGAKKGNQLWQLVLSAKIDSAKSPDLAEKIKKSKILLSGTWKDKPFTYKISKERELQQLELQ